jgi:adenosine deaminase CECR1
MPPLNGAPPAKKQCTVGDVIDAGFTGADEYFTFRRQITDREKFLGFEHRCESRATPLEQRVDSIIRALRERDNKTIYDAAPRRQGYGGQQHCRFAGDHFLSNVDLINQTALLDVACHMPKGAHLHIHFNACLSPSVLLDIAKGMDRMFITSDVPLISDNNYINFDRCEIQFSLRCVGREDPGDLFSPAYRPRQTMRFSEFLRRFPEHYGRATADEWLRDKLVFHDEEAHNLLQTAAGYIHPPLFPVPLLSFVEHG